jgi:parallel beta-helix repeat protein
MRPAHALPRKASPVTLLGLWTLVLAILGASLLGSPAAYALPTSITVCATGCNHPTINSAINASKDGDTITVGPGTYREDVKVTKAVTITGAGAGTTVIAAASRNQHSLTFSTSGATVTGFTITNFYTDQELAAWNFNTSGVIFLDNTTNNTLTNNIISKNRNGIYLIAAQNNTISDNLITDNRTGINLTGSSQGGFNGTTIFGNTIFDNWTLGLVMYDTSNQVNLSTVAIEENTFNRNWYGQVLVKSAPLFTGTLNVTNNTFTDTPVTQSTSSDSSLNEPGFAAQKPVSFGGTAVKPVKPGPTLRIYGAPNATITYDAPPVTVSTVTTSPSGSATVGTTVTITGAVSPSIAAGTIEIRDGATTLGRGTATAGSFTLVTSSLSAGSHSLTAIFTPTNTRNHQASTSTAVTFNVNRVVVPAQPPAQAATQPPRTPVQMTPPVAQQAPVVTEQTPPPPPATAQRVLTELGSSTAQLLDNYQAANSGDAPRAVAQVLTIAAGQSEAGTSAILSTNNFVASMPWAGSSDDQWVDVWAYSTPTFIGTFPVISGVLKISGADLSALATGDHHLVLVGQTSGANEVMSLAIAVPASVSSDTVTAEQSAANMVVANGSHDLGWILWAGVAVLAVAAIATIGILTRRRRASAG